MFELRGLPVSKPRKVYYRNVQYTVTPSAVSFQDGLDGVTIVLPPSDPRTIAVRKIVESRTRGARRRAARDDMMRALGLTKVYGPVSGKVYWE